MRRSTWLPAKFNSNHAATAVTTAIAVNGPSTSMPPRILGSRTAVRFETPKLWPEVDLPHLPARTHLSCCSDRDQAHSVSQIEAIAAQGAVLQPGASETGQSYRQSIRHCMCPVEPVRGKRPERVEFNGLGARQRPAQAVRTSWSKCAPGHTRWIGACRRRTSRSSHTRRSICLRASSTACELSCPS